MVLSILKLSDIGIVSVVLEVFVELFVLMLCFITWFLLRLSFNFFDSDLLLRIIRRYLHVVFGAVELNLGSLAVGVGSHGTATASLWKLVLQGCRHGNRRCHHVAYYGILEFLDSAQVHLRF